jgi:hypothetical protein
MCLLKEKKIGELVENELHSKVYHACGAGTIEGDRFLREAWNDLLPFVPGFPWIFDRVTVCQARCFARYSPGEHNSFW